MRGRKPKPSARRKLAGSRGRGPLAPEPAASATTCPKWLAPAAKLEWKRLASELAESGILTRRDRAALAAYCAAYATWAELQADINAFRKRTGKLIYETRSGAVRPIPQLAEARAAEEQMRKWAAELGLTPSARTRVAPEAPKHDTDELADWLSGDAASADDLEAPPN